ncbi:uncharacterized protein PHALS_07240 [Plasmopara halstedii]|uniref:Uncharacterized protein n=1 Tax=Plasmopara halstedii TaxID=4781 RepID=A0A0P1B4Z2_PLAHL|nr:uncharacterized protein PHALS_07240 [Plasmopara halstedii]CEG49477.1 hypothetical protein PHALS_07240 [Plasmopara halstedii]|eukprot:XP_024585846.1 hypothetical protein PHALS_07240 [Plasmopara halstedii]
MHNFPRLNIIPFGACLSILRERSAYHTSRTREPDRGPSPLAHSSPVLSQK